MTNSIKKILKIKKEVDVKNDQNKKTIIDTGKFFKDMVELLSRGAKKA